MRSYRISFFSLISLLFLCTAFPAFAQSKPAQSKAKETKPALPDSVPTITGLYISADLAGPVMYAFNGDKLQSEVAVELGIKNKFFPILEFGLGYANIESEEGFTFKAKPSPYGRIGLNYAITRKNKNSFFLGLRYGYAKVNYDIYNVTQGSDYWGESQVVDITGQSASASYAQAVAGIRVNVFKNVYLGWDVRYNLLLSTTKLKESRVWFIPGYGINNNDSGGAMFQFNITYKLPFWNKTTKITPQ
ncbi:MAG: DUF6048 family protein [Bacteroidales bacterium]